MESNIKVLLCLLMLSGVFNYIRATQYLGLGYEPGQGKEQRKVQIIDGYIYVPTSNGIYRKNVSTLNDTIWDLYGFKGVSVRDFVKKNDSIIAITTRTNENMMLLSTDNGKTFIDYSSETFKVPGVTASLNLITSNPLNKNSILLSAPTLGLLKSTDFGKTWKTIASIGSLRSIGYNSADTTYLYCAGILSFDMPFIWVSFDDGNTWDMPSLRTTYPQGCFDLHPSLKYPNLILAGFGLWIYFSADYGKTWLKGDRTEIGAVTCFTENSSFFYASGTSYDNKLRVYWSQDGEFWNPLSFQPINGVSSAYDIHIVGNNKLLFTERGVYNISAQNTSLNEATLDVSVVQNGTTVSFKGSEIIESVRIFDISGKLMKTIHPKSNKHTIDISSFQKGLYFFEFGGKDSLIKKKILIR